MVAPEESKQSFDWTTTVYVILIVAPILFAISIGAWKARKTFRLRKQKQVDIELNNRRRDWWQPHFLNEAAAMDEGSLRRAPRIPRERKEIVEGYWRELYRSAENLPQQPPPVHPSSLHAGPSIVRVENAMDVNFSRPRSPFSPISTTTRALSPQIPESEYEETVEQEVAQQPVRRRLRDFDRDLVAQAREASRTDEGIANFTFPGDDAEQTEKWALIDAVLERRAKKAERHQNGERRASPSRRRKEHRRRGDDGAERARRRNRHGSDYRRL